MRFWEELLHALSGKASRPRQLPDLRALPSRSVAVVGTQYLVNDSERHDDKNRLYVLRTKEDANGFLTVAVFSNGRDLGRLPRGAVEPLAAALTTMGGAAVVNGTGTRAGGIRLWVDLPDPDAVTAFAANWQTQQKPR
ncbi:hypothetical protein [Microbacterium testaceum]|uniref:hypothetical protein n=1 Tax=Microbacterium testaceum TaxID=2033 RepID=UPI001243DB0B|nr:hypothetical protein [Microbacterium testaceum]